MKNMSYGLKLIVALIFCCYLPEVLAVLRQDPLLVCTLMIKNEEPVIEETLKAMTEGGIDSFMIYDTGSTDDTVETVNKFFDMHSITNYVVEQEEFVDFATSRNRALALAEKHFPQSTFILMPDAEWIIYNVPVLLDFCEQHRHDNHASYLIRLIQNGGFEFDVERLIRLNSGAQFKCPVHEYLASPSRAKVSRDVYFEYNPTSYGSEKSFKRFKRDLNILLKSYAQNPQEPRIVFYLAQTYACLGDYKNAYRFYELRTQLNGWAEENFMAMYRLAQVVEKLAADDEDKKTVYDWQLAQWYYLKAFSMRPIRIEPLIHVAQHYLAEGRYALAYLFAARASKIPFPRNDILFVEKDMYTYHRYDILGQAAWYIGEYDVGKWALNKALDQCKDKPHLSANLTFYLEYEYQQGGKHVQSLDLDAEVICGCRPCYNRSKEWSILICTLPERKPMFHRLAQKLKNQIREAGLEDKIEILYFLDDREFPIGFKRNKLLQESVGNYINFIDDDDDVHDHYISMIYEKLQSRPDCVSLTGIMTQDGKNPRTFIHSINYEHYFECDGVFYRPPNHLNPIRREIAVLHKFPFVSWHEDFWWAVRLARSHALKNEEELSEPYYFYRHVTK